MTKRKCEFLPRRQKGSCQWGRQQVPWNSSDPICEEESIIWPLSKDDWPSRQVFRIVLPCLIWSDLILSSLVLYYLVLSCLVLYCLVLYYLVFSSCLLFSCLLLSSLGFSCLLFVSWLVLFCACRLPPEFLVGHLSVAQGSCSIVWGECVSVVYCCLSASFDNNVILINEADTRQILYVIVYCLFVLALASFLYVQDS